MRSDTVNRPRTTRFSDRPTALVAAREIREATRTTSFRVTLAISAIALAAIIVVANLGGSGNDAQRIVVAGPDAPARVAPIEQLGAAVGIDVVVTVAPDDRAAAAALSDGKADVAVSADGTRLTTDEEVDLSGGSSLATVVNVLRSDLALENGLRAAGLSAAEAAAVRATPPPTVDALQTDNGNDANSGRQATALITNILLFILLQTYGQWVVTAVTREKASRVVEVLLAVIRPKQLLIGKVIGDRHRRARPRRRADRGRARDDARHGRQHRQRHRAG